MREELHDVTDTEDRRDVEELRVRRWRAVLVHGARTAAENDPRRLPVANPIDASRRRVNLGIHSRFADASRDQLRELRAVIDDENAGASHVRIRSATAC